MIPMGPASERIAATIAAHPSQRGSTGRITVAIPAARSRAANSAKYREEVVVIQHVERLGDCCELMIGCLNQGEVNDRAEQQPSRGNERPAEGSQRKHRPTESVPAEHFPQMGAEQHQQHGCDGDHKGRNPVGVQVATVKGHNLVGARLVVRRLPGDSDESDGNEKRSHHPA